jgi:hypothetical protein
MGVRLLLRRWSRSLVSFLAVKANVVEVIGAR